MAGLVRSRPARGRMGGHASTRATDRLEQPPVTGDLDLAELVELGDPTGLLRAVDGLCARRDWAGLVELRARLEDAVDRGRPLWPMVTWVEYRLALEAPAAEAAAV